MPLFNVTHRCLEDAESFNAVVVDGCRKPQGIDFMLADPERFRLYRSTEHLDIVPADATLSSAIDEYLQSNTDKALQLLAPMPVEVYWRKAVEDGVKPRRVVRAETCFEGESVVIEDGLAIATKGNRYLVTTDPDDPKCFYLVYFSEDIALEESDDCGAEAQTVPDQSSVRPFKVYLEFDVDVGGKTQRRQEYLETHALTFPEAVKKAKARVPEIAGPLAIVDASEPEVSFD